MTTNQRLDKVLFQKNYTLVHKTLILSDCLDLVHKFSETFTRMRNEISVLEKCLYSKHSHPNVLLLLNIEIKNILLNDHAC